MAAVDGSGRRMAKVDLLAPSRAGDKFHYYWAARKALELLRPGTTLTEIVVEGRAPSDRETDADEVIDVSEYFGGSSARRIYSQLKHSTRRLGIEWTLSDFADVITRFATICADLLENGTTPMTAMTFRIVTNRPIAASVTASVTAVRLGGRETASTRALRRYLEPLGTDSLPFLERLEFDDTEPGVLEQVDLLSVDGGSYLVRQSSDLMLRLKEVVADRAATEGHPPIRRSDVLVALKVDENDLLPCPSDLAADGLIDRPAYIELRDRIVAEPGAYVVHASGGVGKSSFSAWLQARGVEGDEVVVFDCFAGGGYRQDSQLRHDHRRGLTQLANELATRNLCDPLVPVETADPTQYMRAFLIRVREAATLLASRSQRLIIVIDAADNAVMAAESQIGSPAFAPGLLRETMPTNVRVVLTARTERLQLLNMPLGTHQLPLAALSVAESRQMLLRKFDDVSEAQGAEFHAVTWGNPRVQAFAIGAADSLSRVLGSLSGIRLTSASEALDELIRASLARVRESYGGHAADIDLVCAVLASLRPVIRLGTVADLAEVPPALVESFLVDLPFSVQRVGDTLHFRDEPTETYFRKHLMPRAAVLDHLIQRVEQHASDNFYLASALPQLLWESGRYTSLIELALADRALPQASSTEAREVAKNRTGYSLRAAIELRDWGSAARLALRAGRLSEASTVRDRLVAQNCDLAGFALDMELADRYVASRSLGMGEPGFNLAREGLLLAGRPDSEGVALGRLRSAYDWMVSYSRLPKHDRDGPRVEIADIADLLLGRLLLEGPTGLEDELARFREWVHFPAMRLVARRFLDRGRPEVLEEFLRATRHRFAALACCQEIWTCDLAVGPHTARSIARLLAQSRARFAIEDRDDPDAALAAALAAVALAVDQKAVSRVVALAVLKRHLPLQPPTYLGDPHHRDRLAYALGSALAASLDGSALDDDSLASKNVQKNLKFDSSSDQETQEYRHNVVPSTPWLNAWAKAVTGELDAADLANLRRSLERDLTGYDPPRLHARWLARVQTSLSARGFLPASLLSSWIGTNGAILGDAVLVRAARALRYQTAKRADVADQIVRFLDVRARSQVEGAAARTALYVDLARTCWTRDEARARDYFLEALDAADLVGDEVHLQWKATNDIAMIALPGRPTERHALGIARAGEAIQRADLLEAYTGDTLRTVAAISPVAAIDIASRWRDRGTSTLAYSLDGVLRHDSDALRAYPDIALAIASLHDSPVGTLAARSSSVPPERALLHAFAVLNRRGARPEHDASLCSFATSSGHPLVYQPVAEGRSHTNSRYLSSSRDKDRERRRRSARAELAALDFSSPAAWTRAFEIAHHKNDLDRADVFPVALPSRSDTDRSSHIRSLIPAIPDLYAAGEAIESFASLLDVSAPERRAIKEAAEQIVSRFSFTVVTSSYRSLPLDVAASLLDQSLSTIKEATFANWTRADQLTTVEGFYALSVHLAELADSAGRIALLDDALAQFAPVIEAISANLPSVDLPTDPGSVHAAVARLVWAALGDPTTAIRWDAAFAVLGLLRLNQLEVLEALADLANVGGSGQAADPAFEFYGMHADWFLLLALRRAIVETEIIDGVRVFAPFVSRILDGQPHAVLTPLAEQLSQALGGDPAGPWPRLEPVQVGWSHRGRDHFKRPDVDYKFNWDFREGQIHKVADAFGLDREVVERDVSDVITHEWGRAERGDRSEDVRLMSGLFERVETSDRYGSPPVHDLDHYLSLNALMTVAGRLAATQRPQQSEGSDEDEFIYWLREHRIVRDDGYWVSETRVGSPGNEIEESGDDGHWRWGIRADDFAPFLHLSAETFACWADYDVAGMTRSEDVRVHTVLVPADLASAYARALQLDRDLWDFRIPLSNDDPDERDDRGYDFETDATDSTSSIPPSGVFATHRRYSTLRSLRSSRTIRRRESPGGATTVRWSPGLKRGTIMATVTAGGRVRASQ
jgi:hypothetical protein